jgi:high-affinity nickel-transport protein
VIDMILLVSNQKLGLLDSVLTSKGGCICGAFVAAGVFSVILYKPWRRRIDRRRAQLLPPSGEYSDVIDSGTVEEDLDERRTVEQDAILGDPVESTVVDASRKK